MTNNIKTLLSPFSLLVISVTLMIVIVLKSPTSLMYLVVFITAVLLFGASTYKANMAGAIACFLTGIVIIGRDIL